MAYLIGLTFQDDRSYTSGEGMLCGIIGKHNSKNTTSSKVTFIKLVS